MSPRVLAVVNHKGGVGKTSTSVNLAAALGRVGRQVLVIDLDPQAHATVHLGIDRATLRKSMLDVMVSHTAISDVVQTCRSTKVSIAPSKISLAIAEVDLQRVPGRDLVLREKLDAVRQRFDVALIDCPPSLGVLTWNALAAADEILIPVQAEFLALDGVANLVEIIDLVQARLNPKLSLRGVVLTMFDPRTRGTMAMHVQTEEQARQYFGNKVCKTRIRRNARLSEAPSHGVSIFEHAPDSSGAIDYMNLAMEVFHDGEAAETRARIEPAQQALGNSA